MKTPIRLAYAITTHKVRGDTLTSGVIDLGKSEKREGWGRGGRGRGVREEGGGGGVEGRGSGRGWMCPDSTTLIMM